MGVLGLVPFLQKQCPQVIRTIPERLRDFGGKTIVFDGTLITCRFHFSATPHDYKHVLGWYKVITELRNNNVNAICVFDGAGRSAAKALESEKRQVARRLALSRWSIEVKRQERLRELYGLLKRSMALPLDQRMVAVSQLQSFIKEKRAKARKLRLLISEESTPGEFDDSIQGQPVSLWPPPEAFDDHASFDNDENLQSFPLIDAEQATWADDSMITDQDFLFLDQRPQPLIQYDISEQLMARGILLEGLARKTEGVVPSTNNMNGLSEDVLESRKQLALTHEEEVVWARIERMIADPRYLKTPALLKILIHRSQVVCDTYQRQGKPPTEATYAECKMILRALGVPYIDVTGPYEAEGFAAALVRRGVAHYVASEDTDVLLYGAPLLRQVTLRNGAINIISPEEVRRALCLSRAAFMDFALLLGTDFAARLRNVGPVRALNFISTHSRIERVVKHESRYIPSDVPSYLEQIRQARLIFTTLPPTPPKGRFKSREVDKEKVTEVLTRFGLSRAAEDADWDPAVSLAGNYFADDPTGGGTEVGMNDIQFR